MRWLSLIAILLLPAPAPAQGVPEPVEKPLTFEVDLTGPSDKKRTFRCEDAQVVERPGPLFSQETDALAIHSRQQERHRREINRRTLRGCE